MSYFVIENFGHGLDVRKHILNLPPGTLYAAKNVNINRGGEPETAKAFVYKYALQPGRTFGLLAAGGKLYVFGSDAGASVPSDITYQSLPHPTGGDMTAVIHATPIKGKPFVIASYTSGYGVFFDGVLVADFLPILPAAGSMADVAANFASQINAHGYTASAAGNVVTITGAAGTPFTISASATNGVGGVNDQSAAVATVQNAVAGSSSEVLAKCTITVNGVTGNYDPDSGHTFDELVCAAIRINGVDVLMQQIYAQDDISACYGIRNYINVNTSTPDYTATLSGNVVTITALAGTGATPNGWPVVVDSGSKCTPTDMAGGIGAGTGSLPQISTVTFGGTYEVADSYSVTINGTVYLLAGGATSANPLAGQRPTMALTKDNKTYAIAGPNLLGSEINDPTDWDSGTGHFATDMSTEVAGAEILTALAYFQGNLAVFSRSTVQIEFVDPDPSNNDTIQVLQNIGTLAPKSVVTFGDSDVFFLSDTGLRSLKVRTATESATLSDIGSPIDGLLINAIRASAANAQKAVGAIEPIDGRFMLQLGMVTYVFSFFPDAKVSGWTTYETGYAFTDFAILNQRLYARAGDQVFLLGGDNNDVFGPAPDIKLPFLSARSIATLKHFKALDVVCDGTFDVYISTDPQQPDVEELIGTVAGTTLGQGSDPFGGEDVSSLALRFKGRANKYARLSAIAVHYVPLRENAP